MVRSSSTTTPLPPEALHALLAAAFVGAEIAVRDDTHLHADHNEQVHHHGGHYKVKIIWAGFATMPRVARQRAVQQAVATAWAKGQIHALTLQLLTPETATLRDAPLTS
jgi:BolA family transcriptional regulator, general stress-responsive regulator